MKQFTKNIIKDAIAIHNTDTFESFENFESSFYETLHHFASMINMNPTMQNMTLLYIYGYGN